MRVCGNSRTKTARSKSKRSTIRTVTCLFFCCQHVPVDWASTWPRPIPSCSTTAIGKAAAAAICTKGDSDPGCVCPACLCVCLHHRRNPHNDMQAMDRAHRIGQKKEVNVYRFITEVRSTLLHYSFVSMQGRLLIRALWCVMDCTDWLLTVENGGGEDH